MADNLYDEFGNYIGPDIDGSGSSSESSSVSLFFFFECVYHMYDNVY